MYNEKIVTIIKSFAEFYEKHFIQACLKQVNMTNEKNVRMLLRMLLRDR